MEVLPGQQCTLNSVTGTGHAKYESRFPTCIIPEDSACTMFPSTHLKYVYMASSHANVKKETPHVLLMVSPHNTSEDVLMDVVAGIC